MMVNARNISQSSSRQIQSYQVFCPPDGCITPLNVLAVRYTEYVRISPNSAAEATKPQSSAAEVTLSQPSSSQNDLTVDNDDERAVHYKRLKPGKKSKPKFTYVRSSTSTIHNSLTLRKLMDLFSKNNDKTIGLRLTTDG